MLKWGERFHAKNFPKKFRKKIQAAFAIADMPFRINIRCVIVKKCAMFSIANMVFFRVPFRTVLSCVGCQAAPQFAIADKLFRTLSRTVKWCVIVRQCPNLPLPSLCGFAFHFVQCCPVSGSTCLCHCRQVECENPERGVVYFTRCHWKKFWENFLA
jgi:hypothetical protein